MSYADARLVLDALPDTVPPGLAGLSVAEIEAAWPDWASRRDADIRGRLERGDEDSIVNLWLFGTSFTRHPPARESDRAASGGPVGLADVVRGRLDDFLDALGEPGDNQRLQFAREFMGGKGLDPAVPRGRREIRQRLEAAYARAVDEFAAYDRMLDEARRRNASEAVAYASIFSGRGLSSDTSILADFALEQTLRSLRTSGVLAPGSVRRVAVVGPGLDFINKADGHDFYPQQTIQPFALVDSLLRLGLARESDLRVTTFDLSSRVNHHLAEAVEEAARGRGYTLHLPLAAGERWAPDMVRFWERLGDQVGDPVPAERPREARDLRLRAVRVRPDVVRSIDPRDVNIVVERLPLSPGDRFDLVVGTNVFVYYESFEQALALANIASMLRPEGVLLSNTLMVPTSPMESSAAHAVITYSDRQYDHMFWYQRQP